jgi:hypothetical protein
MILRPENVIPAIIIDLQSAKFCNNINLPQGVLAARLDNLLSDRGA